MNALWQNLTLANLPTYQWRRSSLIGKLVGLLYRWRRGSWLIQWSTEIAVGLLSLVFGLAPFVPNSMIGVMLTACVGFWVLLTLSDAPERSRLNPIHLLVLLYWGIATVATALSPVKSAAFVGWTKLSLYLLFFALVERVVRSPRWRSWLITVYLHVALVVSLYGLRQWLFGADALATWTDPESSLANTTRVYSYLDNPNLLAGYLLPAIPFSLAALFAWRGWLPKLLAGLMLVMNTLCLILTFSRGGWLGLVMALFAMALLLLFWLLPHLPTAWRTWAFPVLLGGLGGILLLAILFVPPVRDRVTSIFADRKDSSNNFRINVWAAVHEMIRDRPILGIGPGNTAFNQIYPLFQRPGFTALGAYSVYLELLVETGFVGFSAFLWLILVTLQRGWQQLKNLRDQGSRETFWLIAAISILLGMMTHGAVDTVWYRPEVATLWWLAMAIIASYNSSAPAAEPEG
ncbi:MAG: IctB family putative bicarbonate transporter [Aphanocapsa sp. GSE-SYN-MK-11-07L]|jgi:putative inorganic carbon (HCO3(-)) transporter|nr:IctB family putative bicarbonate transporter [Aphanocapsa sp. GSE-SYN-MK-11-07L]